MGHEFLYEVTTGGGSFMAGILTLGLRGFVLGNGGGFLLSRGMLMLSYRIMKKKDVRERFGV